MTEERLIVEGGRRLEGAVRISGAKNAVLPCMVASLLTADDCYLENVPNIGDVEIMADVLRSLGVDVEHDNPRGFRLKADRLKAVAPPGHLVSSQRASFLIVGALLARQGWAACSPPGGDVIGQRPIDVHLSGFAALGGKVHREHDKIVAEAHGLKGARIFLDYPSVLGTENILLASVTAHGTTVIINAAAEPEVVALADMLNEMGAIIHGAGTHTVTVEGVAQLHGVQFRIIPDRIEAGTYAIAGVMTAGEIELTGADPSHLDALIEKLREIGAHVEVKKGSVFIKGDREIRGVAIQAVPYPGLATDLQAPMAALLTQARGISYIHERVFENRLLYVGELRKLGAEVVTTGTTAIISGPCQLVGTSVRALDVRAGAALVLAGLVAEGRTEIDDVYHLRRGYEDLDAKLISLGASVSRVEV